MRFLISTILAGLLATTPLALAQADCSSVVCELGDWACNRVCEMQGQTQGGRCVARDGCPAGSKICACGAKKMKARDVADRSVTDDGDKLLERGLQGVTTVDKFIDAVFEKRDEPEAGAAAAVEKRSVCCSFPDPWGGLCCEAHCQQIGRREGGQCSSQNVCVCG
jgi:hypothetical protein